MSNLPPGCKVTDIPGNRPSDLAFEEFSVALKDVAHELKEGDGLGDVEDDGDVVALFEKFEELFSYYEEYGGANGSFQELVEYELGRQAEYANE